jgi:hypothetical protein
MTERLKTPYTFDFQDAGAHEHVVKRETSRLAKIVEEKARLRAQDHVSLFFKSDVMLRYPIKYKCRFATCDRILLYSNEYLEHVKYR